LAHHYQEEKQDAFLDLDFPFQQGKWISVAFATKKIKKQYIGVIVSVSKGEPIVNVMNFTRRVENSSMFIWLQTDDICKIETKDIVAYLPEPIKSRRGDMIFPTLSFSILLMCITTD
jgi:hypothetical protein